MAPFKDDRLQVTAAGEDDERPLRAPHREAEVAEEESESNQESGNPDQGARRQALDEEPW